MLTSVASEIQLSRGSWITDPAKNTALEAALLQVVAVLPPLPLEPPEPEELAVDLDSMCRTSWSRPPSSCVRA
jgi:hypothetical protein